MQSFSLPGEAQKAAKILKSFLGESSAQVRAQLPCLTSQPTRINPSRHLTRSRKRCCSEQKVSETSTRPLRPAPSHHLG
jgi:hypothetical protein